MPTGIYCTAADLPDHLLPQYLEAAERHHAGITSRTVTQVNAEIDEALAGRYALPLATVPRTLVRLGAVIAAYRILSAITSLVQTEAGSGNEFLPLQRQAQAAEKTLEKLAAGELDLGLPRLGAAADPAAGPTVVTISPAPVFDAGAFAAWRRS